MNFVRPRQIKKNKKWINKQRTEIDKEKEEKQSMEGIRLKGREKSRKKEQKK